MAKQTINLGAAADDGTGDPLRTAGQKINENTDELYNFISDINDDISEKADRDGDSLTNASVNEVTLKTNEGDTKFLDGNGDYSEVQAIFGELSRGSNGNQQLTTSKSKLDFNTGTANLAQANVTGDNIRVDIAGHYRVSFTGSAIFKKNSVHTFYLRVNGVALTDVQIGCIELSDDNNCSSFSLTKVLNLSALDYVEIWATTESNKDFKMQAGVSFSAIRV